MDDALRKLLNPPKTHFNCRKCYPRDCTCPDCEDTPAEDPIATQDQPGPTEGMTKEEIWADLDKGLLAMCPDCGVKTKTPLPEDWVWDSPEMHRWAWCPKCNLHKVRAAAAIGKQKGKEM